MNEIFILFIILGTLFIIENKSINLLAYYVGMVIIIAILITIFPNLNNIEQSCNGISYISYMLVLVQISALTILFGFIIMLYPKNNTDILIKEKNPKILLNNINNSIKKIIYIILIISFILFNIYLYMNNINIINILVDVINENNIVKINNINYFNIENETSTFLNKISYLLYTEPSNIFKFMVLTIILLFAIICLFFILYPTI